MTTPTEPAEQGKPLQATPEHALKPQLVWLGHFLGMDVYMDVQPVGGSQKHADLARRFTDYRYSQ